MADLLDLSVSHHRLGTRRPTGEPHHQRAQRDRRRARDGRELQPLGRRRHRRGVDGLRRIARPHRAGRGRGDQGSGGPTPIRHLVYTHGHADHVGGSKFFAADASRRHRPRERRQALRPVLVHQRLEPAHQRPPVRRRVAGDLQLNDGRRRQRRRDRSRPRARARRRFIPASTHCVPIARSALFDRMHDRRAHEVEFHHARGETDDHLWSFFPDQQVAHDGRLPDLELPQRR